jgi:hypothetical protein
MTIIPSDSIVTIDGVSFSGIDMSSLDSSIHAVQWYGTYGELEIKDLITNKMIANIKITNFDIFQNLIDQFNTKKEAHDAELSELAAIQDVQEV